VTALAALLVGACVWWWLPVRPDDRLAHVAHRARLPARHRGHDSAAFRWVATSAAAAALFLLVGGLVGGVAAVAALLLMPRLLRRLEPRAVREHRDRLTRQSALLADLLAATLASGATARDALDVAAHAVGEPTASFLAPVVGAIDLGSDPTDAWGGIDPPEAHRAIVDALRRAHRSGAPASGVLARAADDLRREHRREVEVAARAAGVRAVGPLAACFLPAFLLIGVVPVVASLAAGLVGVL
jgi:Flp pilus assembly protein TadB